MQTTSSSELEVKARICDFLPAVSQVLSIGEVARRTGVAASALRFYEERGLIASERAGAGHRRYPVRCCAGSRSSCSRSAIGLTLDEIAAELAKLPGDRVPSRRDWSRLSSTWKRGSTPGSLSSSGSRPG